MHGLQKISKRELEQEREGRDNAEAMCPFLPYKRKEGENGNTEKEKRFEKAMAVFCYGTAGYAISADGPVSHR